MTIKTIELEGKEFIGTKKGDWTIAREGDQGIIILKQFSRVANETSVVYLTKEEIKTLYNSI